MPMNVQSQDGNFGSEENNHTSSEEELLGSSSSFIKKELEVMLIGVVERSIGPTLERLIGPMLERSIGLTLERLTGPMLEPLTRKVEEITLAVEKILTSKNRNPGDEIHPSELRRLQLRFSNEISQPVFTGENIRGKESDSMKVALFDASTGEVVNSGPLASGKVEIVVLEGDFEGGGQDWTPEEFNQNVVKEGEGKGSLHTRKTHFNLKGGVEILEGMSFKRSKKCMKNCKLRLGARLVDNPSGTRVREAKTEPFLVKDYRNKSRKKHYPPSLDDKVWRLENIGRKGHEHLKRENIKTVEDFLREYNGNPEKLRNTLGASDKQWEATVKHALTCPLEKTVIAHKLVVSAYEHSNDIVPYEGEASIVFNAEIPSISLQENPSPCNVNYALASDTYDGMQPPSTSYAGADGFDYSWPEIENDFCSHFPDVESIFGQQTYDTQNSNLGLLDELLAFDRDTQNSAVPMDTNNYYMQLSSTSYTVADGLYGSFFPHHPRDTQNSNVGLSVNLWSRRTVLLKVVVKFFALHRDISKGNTRATKRQRCSEC